MSSPYFLQQRTHSLLLIPVHDHYCSGCEQTYILNCHGSWLHQAAALPEYCAVNIKTKCYLLNRILF